jgi:hypothetical protein
MLLPIAIYEYCSKVIDIDDIIINNIIFLGVRNKVIAAVFVPIMMFWVVTPCSLVGRHRGFGVIYCLYILTGIFTSMITNIIS